MLGDALSPWQNAYVETFNGKLEDELLAGEMFFIATRVDIHNRVVIITIRLWMTPEKQLCKPPNASI